MSRAGQGLSPQQRLLQGGTELSSTALGEGQRKGQGHPSSNCLLVMLGGWELALEWREHLTWSSTSLVGGFQKEMEWSCGCFLPSTLRAGLGPCGPQTQSSNSYCPLMSEVRQAWFQDVDMVLGHMAVGSIRWIGDLCATQAGAMVSPRSLNEGPGWA